MCSIRRYGAAAGVLVLLAFPATSRAMQPSDYPKKGPEIRRSVGEEGVEPGSKLRETEKSVRQQREEESARMAKQMPGKAGIASPRPGEFDEPEDDPAQVKQRADRTVNRIIPEVDPETNKAS